MNLPNFRFCKAIAIRLPRMPNLIAVSEVSIKLCFESESGKKVCVGARAHEGVPVCPALRERCGLL